MPIECCGGLLAIMVGLFVFVGNTFPAPDGGNSTPGFLVIRSKGWGCALGVLAVVFGRCAFGFRADNNEDLAYGRKVDVVAGGLFAVAFLLTRLAHQPPRRRSWKYVTAVGVVLWWVGTSGSLLALHEAVAKVRFTNASRSITLHRIQTVYLALEEYKADCGSYPANDVGVIALCISPDIPGWGGPYLQPNDLIDSWGNPIRYTERDGQLVVWSCGKDGVSGTEDDLIYPRE